MKRKALKKHWPEIEAFKDGVKIQLFIDGLWINTENPKFHHKNKYRIDPSSALEYYRKKPIDTSQIDEILQKDFTDPILEDFTILGKKSIYQNESAEDKACRENMLNE